MTLARRAVCLAGILGAAITGVSAVAHAQDASRRQNADHVHGAYPEPHLAFEETEAESAPDDSLADAIVEMAQSNPQLAAQRYDLRGVDDELSLALAQTRANVQLQISSGYDYTMPGRITQASRPLADRLNDPNIERNEVTGQLILDQPLSTGGRARGAVRAARAAILSGREVLRGAEGDLLLDLIAAYGDVRRDSQVLAIREKTARVLAATLDEVIARREAGELTRTDIAQAQSQLQAAHVQRNAAEAQLEASRAAFAAIVGRQPGRLAPEPSLPGLPVSIDEAFAAAEQANPDLGAAIANERASRARIAAARAEGNPELHLRGTAGITGPVSPFDRRDQDVTLTGRATLTIPLVSGGRVRALVAQAENRNSADALRIEATRRQMVQAIIRAWNEWVTTDRNLEAQTVQLRAARIFYEGTYEEYREGLRSTFDVLYAQNALRETEIAILASKRDRYVAQAALLRQLGALEAGKLVEAAPAYDPESYTRRAMRRSSMPWDGLVRVIDRIGSPGDKPQALEWPKRPATPPALVPAPPPLPDRSLATHGPAAAPQHVPGNSER